MSKLKLVDQINDPGNPEKPSEDVIGFDSDKRICWVIDGASDDYIDMPQDQITGERLNAYWAANTLSKLFKSHADIALRDTPEYFRRVLNDFKEIFEQASGQKTDDIPREKHPIAAFAWARYQPETHTLTLAGLGDCKAYAMTDKGQILENTTTTNPDYERLRDAAWAKEFGNKGLSLNREGVRERLIAIRRVANMPDRGGSSVLGPHPEAAAFVSIEEIDLSPQRLDTLFISSDGLMRLSDTFEEYTADLLFEAVLDNSLHYMIHQELRPREKINMEQSDTPVVKSHDDAAAAVFKIIDAKL